MQPDMKICPECKTPNPVDATVCSNCGSPFAIQTLSFKRAEIDDRDPTLRILLPNGKPFTSVLNKKITSIGREEGQDVRIDAAGVANRHARLMAEGSGHRIFDITPGQGLWVNGKATDSAILHDGDSLRLQDAQGIGVNLAYSNPSERVLEAAADAGQLHAFTSYPFTIGRDPASLLKMDALAVSWRHARIEQVGGGHSLTDLESANGTFVNDRRVKGTIRLHPDDVVRLDTTLYIYRPEGLTLLPSLQQFQLDGHDLGMTFIKGLFKKTEFTALHDATISVKPQELVAIIGGSGSGKSTLLRVLNGAARATHGSVLVNGDDLYAHYSMYQPVIGYVPQLDIVQNNLSVREVLTYGARLRFPKEPLESRDQRIRRVLDDVELKESENQLVRDLSGGQRKRVSIALELMAEPGLLFADEPSSGLDPGLDKAIMDIFRKLATRGHVILVVTHTTLNIDLCDRLALVSRGNLAWYGPPKEALSFFGVRSYPELYNRVQTPPERQPTGTRVSAADAAKQWAEKYRASAAYESNVVKRLLPPSERVPDVVETTGRLAGTRRGSFWGQTRTLADRTLALVRRDLRTLAAMLLVLPLVGFFLAGISYDTIFKVRGQMLVSRGDDQTMRTDILEKLPLLPITPREVAANPNDAVRNTPINAVKGMATFSPANDAQRLLFMGALSVVLLGLFTAAYTIVIERPLFLRERMVNLRIAPYLVSKLLVYGALSLIAAAFFEIAIAVGVRIPDQGMFLPGFLELYITLALTAITGVALGLLISTLTDAIDTATYAVLAVLLVQILFPGVLFKMDGVLKPLSQLTVTRWSLEALGGTIDMNARNAEGRIVIQSLPVRNGVVLVNAPPGLQVYPAPSPQNLDYPDQVGGLLLRWGVLVLFTGVLMVAAGVLLDRSEPF